MEQAQDFGAGAGQVDPLEFLESVVFEDGLAAAIELAETPWLVPGANAVTIPLLISKLLSSSAFARLGLDDPFDADEPDALLGYLDEGPSGGAVVGAAGAWACPEQAERERGRVEGSEGGGSRGSGFGGSGSGESGDPGWELARLFEDTTREAHAAVQSMAAVRARSVTEFARFEHPDGPQASTKKPWVRREAGFTSLYAADSVAAELRLGTQAASSLVEKSAWMVNRTPRLLAQVAAGEVNLDTVAAVAAELQDASPDVCETVEDRLMARGSQFGARGPAARSARTLMERCQPGAARQTAKKTKAQQCGVFQDSHPTPGLSSLTVIGDADKLTAIMDAVDARAWEMRRHDKELLLGEHRVNALFDLVMQGVTLTLDIQVLTPTTAFGQSGTPGQPGTPEHPGNPGGGTPPRGPSGGKPPDPSSPMPTTPAPSRAANAAQVSALLAGTAARGAVAVHARGGPIGFEGLAGLARFASKVTISDLEFDPGTGQLTDAALASESYRPPAWMKRRVRARDHTCRAPGCSRPVVETDQDHAVPWPHGPTAPVNLHLLCRRHHRMKQSGGWNVRLDADGVAVWFSPTGRVYSTTPPLLDTWHDLTDELEVKA